MKYLIKYKLKEDHSFIIDADNIDEAETKANYYMSKAWSSYYYRSMVKHVNTIEIPNLYVNQEKI